MGTVAEESLRFADLSDGDIECILSNRGRYNTKIVIKVKHKKKIL